MAEIQLRNLSKRWGTFVGVDKFDLTIADKEFLVLLGPSGCGKTTTMRMIAGLEDATEGDILIGGKVVNDLQPKDRDVAMVFQSYALYPNMNVYENIRFPLKVRGVDPKTHDAKVRRASAMVELDPFLHRKPAELAVTTVYVTHDQIEAMTLADRVVVMEKGIVQQVGSPTEIYDRPANSFVASFIGSPAMNLIEGHLQNGRFTAPGVGIDGLRAADGQVTLGFRAEDAQISQAQSGDIRAPIYSIELLGDATMVTIRINEALVSVKADKGFRAAIHDEVFIKVPTEICHLFDRQTGARIGE